MRPSPRTDLSAERGSHQGSIVEELRLLLTMALMKLLEGSYQGEKTPPSSRRRGEGEKNERLTTPKSSSRSSGESEAGMLPECKSCWLVSQTEPLKREIKKDERGQPSHRQAFRSEGEGGWV